MAMYEMPKDDTQRGTVAIERFNGVDFTNSASKCALSRSPDAVNFMRITPGKAGKRPGWRTESRGLGRINGRHLLKSPDGDVQFIHAGAKLYRWTPGEETELTEVYADANNARSTSVMLGGRLCVFDGKKLLLLSGDSVVAAESLAKVPKSVAGRTPNGGGVMLEPLNLLTPKRCEGFYGTADDTVYELSNGEISSVERIEKLNASGGFDTLPAAAYTVDMTAGKITFATPPGVSLADGKDNILVWYSKTVPGYADRVNKATMCTLYGVNGAQNRIFATGAPDFTGRDCFSEVRDATYWGDVWYNSLGDEKTAILNYAVVNNYLTAFKASGQNNVNVYLRSGKLEKVTEKVNESDVVYYEPAFEISGTYQSEEIVSAHSFQMFDNEPIFLTRRGVHALTLISFTSERNSELRSYYLNGTGYKGLLSEDRLEQACSAVWNGFYVLCVNSHCYLLDSLQPVQENGALDSNSKKQFEGFYWEGVPARIMWEQGGELWFGTTDGRLCRFRIDTDSPEAYADDGAAVQCRWDTANLRGAKPMKKTTILSVSYIMSAYIKTSAEVYIAVTGYFKRIAKLRRSYRFFAYDPFDYADFNYSGDSTEQTYNQKVRVVKNVDKFQLRLENNECEPFAIERIEADYRQGGNYMNRG